MMRTKLTLVAASLATLMMTTAHAAPTPVEADLSISAKVVPSACNLDFANHGTYDYGDIPLSALAASGETVLSAKELSYTIACNAPTTVSLGFVDNRSGTVAAYPGLGGHPDYSFGVGQASGVNIGANTYTFINTGVLVDGNPGSVLAGDGTTWYGYGSTVPVLPTRTGALYSFSNSPGVSSAVTPAAQFTTATGSLQAVLAIAPTSSLNLTREIIVDGFATVELTYI